jgi:hypothetical protein
VSDRDAAARLLAGVVRLLPASRREWGRAMEAELAAIARPAERRRYALSSLRGVVALTGRRPGFCGPAPRDGATRAVRAAGLGLVAACLLGILLIDTSNMHGPLPPTVLVLLACAFLAATARGTRFTGLALASGALAGIVMGGAGFALKPYLRIGTPLADHLPGRGGWLILVVFGAPMTAALVAGLRTRRRDQAVMAALCAGTFAALTFAALGFAAIGLFPGSVPDVVGSVMWPGTSVAARRAADAQEASDPYWGYLLFSALLSAILWAVARPPRKPDLKLAAPAVLALPPIALALVAGQGTIALATALVALATVMTTRRGVAASS